MLLKASMPVFSHRMVGTGTARQSGNCMRIE